MIHDVVKNTNKAEVILATNHRYFTRSVIIAIINVILLLLLTTGLAIFMMLVVAMVAGENPSKAPSTTGITLVLIAALYVINFASFLYNMIHLKSMHKQVSDIEESFLNEPIQKPKQTKINAEYEEEYDLH